MPDRRNRIGEALDVLADTSIPPEEAVARFRRLARRWSPATRGAAFAAAVVIRRDREEAAGRAALERR